MKTEKFFSEGETRKNFLIMGQAACIRSQLRRHPTVSIVSYFTQIVKKTAPAENDFPVGAACCINGFVPLIRSQYPASGSSVMQRVPC